MGGGGQGAGGASGVGSSAAGLPAAPAVSQAVSKIHLSTLTDKSTFSSTDTIPPAWYSSRLVPPSLASFPLQPPLQVARRFLFKPRPPGRPPSPPPPASSEASLIPLLLPPRRNRQPTGLAWRPTTRSPSPEEQSARVRNSSSFLLPSSGTALLWTTSSRRAIPPLLHRVTSKIRSSRTRTRFPVILVEVSHTTRSVQTDLPKYRNLSSVCIRCSSALSRGHPVLDRCLVRLPRENWVSHIIRIALPRHHDRRLISYLHPLSVLIAPVHPLLLCSRSARILWRVTSSPAASPPLIFTPSEGDPPTDR